MPNGHIYKITNTLNGDFYIGKTNRSVAERFSNHLSLSKTGETHLYRAMRKYGKDNFVVETLEQTESPNEREIELISQLNPHYNMTAGGDGGDTSSSPNYIAGMATRQHPHTPSYGMLGKQHPFKGQRQSKLFKTVVCEGVEYPSIRDASERYGFCIRRRLDNIRYPDFYRK